MGVEGSFLASGRSDGEDRLIEADEPLAGLQLRSGGDIPGTIATPALLELVRKARMFGLRLARPIHAYDDHEQVTVWVEVIPNEDGEEGCEICLANWQSAPLPAEDFQEAAQRRIAIDHQLAEVSARLDPQQHILSVESDTPELRPLIEKMRAGAGRPWTDFVGIDGSTHHQPLHWRLLDGARVTLEGSDRDWKASLVPLGGPEPGTNGFELYLVADQPPGTAAIEVKEEAAPQTSSPSIIGRGIAPVLRQPISRIIANAETIRTRLAGPLADEYSNYAADITAAGEHLLAMIEDLSDLEVVETEGFVTAPDLIDLADVARRAAGILSMRAKERRIEIEVPDHSESMAAIGEFRRVLQVLLNLIGNAIRYSPEGTQVSVQLGGDANSARISVVDQGPGLTADEQEAVFMKFERLGRSGDGGSGLGLYISRRLAQAMGGELTIDSTLGHGARFTLTLPTEE